MKFVLFTVGSRFAHAGILTEAGVIDASVGLGFLRGGEPLKIDIHGIGAFERMVGDPRRRKWERGVSLRGGSTNHEAVKRNRPDAVLTEATVPANG